MFGLHVLPTALLGMAVIGLVMGFVAVRRHERKRSVKLANKVRVAFLTPVFIIVAIFVVVATS
jgi:hypothetical protein